MFNAEKLLGGLIRSSTRGRRGLGGLASSGVALGALGVAMEAVEHYLGNARPSTPPPSRPPAPVPPSPGVPPPPPAAGGTSTAPPPPPPMAASPADSPPDAVLLIRAMIAAANADGMIDAAERSSILARLQAVELSPEEHAFIARELLTPADVDTIAASVRSADLARQVYAVSFMAIAVDTDAERRYMDRLAGRLELDQATVDQIERRVGTQ